MSNLVKCPFCGEDRFDLIGLKSHLYHGHCDVYNNTPFMITIQYRAGYRFAELDSRCKQVPTKTAPEGAAVDKAV